jgi:flagellar assembly protein FliH
MIIKRHLIYVDSKSVRKIGKEEKDESKEDLREEIEKKRMEIIQEAEIRAKEIIESAKAEAEKILEDANEKAKNIEESLKKEYAMKIEELEALKVDVLNFKSLLLSKMEEAIEDLIDMALPLMKIIYRKILEKDIDDDLARRRIKSALEKIFETANVRFRISVEDSSKIGDLIQELGSEGMDVVVDPSLKKGDVVVETSLGVIDKTTSFRWKMVEDMIDEVL